MLTYPCDHIRHAHTRARRIYYPLDYTTERIRNMRTNQEHKYFSGIVVKIIFDRSDKALKTNKKIFNGEDLIRLSQEKTEKLRKELEI